MMHISKFAFGAETAEQLDKIMNQNNVRILVETRSLPKRIKEFINDENWPIFIEFLEEELPCCLNAGDVPERLLRDIKESQYHIISELKSLGFRSLSERLPLRERESGRSRLGEKESAYRAALDEWTRVRESETKRLEGRVSANRAALEAVTRDRLVPLEWARIQNDLGTMLATLGERESGTKRLEQAVAAYGAALEELTRVRESGAEWLKERVSDYGKALEELTRVRVTKETVAGYRAALEAVTRDQLRPLEWATIQNKLGPMISTLDEREIGTERLEHAVSAYRAALEEYTHERVLLNWAMTQNKLGTALCRLGERESGTERLEQAVAAFSACLTVIAADWPEEWVQQVRSHLDETRAEIARRTAK